MLKTPYPARINSGPVNPKSPPLHNLSEHFQCHRLQHKLIKSPIPRTPHCSLPIGQFPHPLPQSIHVRRANGRFPPSPHVYVTSCPYPPSHIKCKWIVMVCVLAPLIIIGVRVSTAMKYSRGCHLIFFIYNFKMLTWLLSCRAGRHRMIKTVTTLSCSLGARACPIT